MRESIQKVSNTDKQITLTLLRTVWLSYLLSIGSTSAGTLSIFSVAAIVGTEPAHANLFEQPAHLPDQAVEEEPVSYTSSDAMEQDDSVVTEQTLPNEESLQTAEEDNQTIADISSNTEELEKPNFNGHLQEIRLKADRMPTPQEFLEISNGSESSEQQLSVPLAVTEESTTVPSAIAPKPPVDAPAVNTVEHHLPVQLAVEGESTTVPSAIVPKPPVVEPTQHSVDDLLPVNWTVADEPTTVPSALVPKPPVETPEQNSVEPQQSINLAVIGESTTLPSALIPKPPVETPEQNSVKTQILHDSPAYLITRQGINSHLSSLSPFKWTEIPSQSSLDDFSYETVVLTTGGLSQGVQDLSKTLIVAQTSGENEPDRSLIPQNSPPKNEALTPTLDVQGVYLQQDEASARARLRGIYPVSPNALFGAIVDLATGDDFAGTEGSGLNLTELYFTGSLPSYSNLRLTVGLMDLTSYFDRNSFAKDSTTHFFHPLFQTNPALASAGIGSRPGALLNWNITDNVEAKAAVFSSERSLGSFSLDAFAGEIGFRAGNGIIRATYASNQDTGRDGVFGTRNGDRENAFGINGELYIPQIKMGLFARYGWLDNSDQDDNTETYNFGFNFLDLFRKDDRLGLGYAFGRDFSQDNDVWELFYDIRVARNLRAGVTLQEREGFSETILGFRVKTDLPLYP